MDIFKYHSIVYAGRRTTHLLCGQHRLIKCLDVMLNQQITSCEKKTGVVVHVKLYKYAYNQYIPKYIYVVKCHDVMLNQLIPFC